MNRQRGLATLLVTTMILVVSLVFSLASYKNLFYQIKRTQNEVMARKAHWLAEGGVECGLSTIFNSSTPQNADQAGFFPNSCMSSLGVDLTAVKNGMNYELTSNYSNLSTAIIKKSVRISSTSGKSGAIRTGSNMYSWSSLTIYNPEPGEKKGSGWECVAVRYRDKYEPTGSITNFGLLATPNPSFDPQGKDCLTTHKTTWNGVGDLKSDFVHDPSMSPFEDFFNVDDKQHNEIRDGYFDVVLTKGKNFKGISDCGKEITDALNNGNEKIWVEGSCEVAGDDYISVVNESNRLDGVLILVHDGMFSLFPKPGGESDSKKYNGLLFHYNIDYKYNFDDWEGSEAYKHLSHSSSDFGDKVHLASYYLHGALNINGGVILDAKHYDTSSKKYISQNALLYDSFAMTYNGNYFSKFEGGGGNVVNLIEGSWHDF